jgi:hypothetical protein
VYRECQREFGFFFVEGSIYRLLILKGCPMFTKNLSMGQSMWLLLKVKIKVVGAPPI